MSIPPVIVWLRRDIRLHDHTALAHARQSGQPIIVLFIFDPALLTGPRMSTARIEFMLSALTSLDADLHPFKTRLLIRRGEPTQVLINLARETGANQLYFNLDYTPYARRRDQTVTQTLPEHGVMVHSFHDRLLVTPDQISSGSGNPYTVFTPFKNKWRTIEHSASPLEYTLSETDFYSPGDLIALPIPTITDLSFTPSGVDLPPVSEAAAHARLETFIQSSIFDYKDARNLIANPNEARNGTSFLSPYIRFGLLSLRQIRTAAARAYQATSQQTRRDSVTAYMDEIIWHEFYTHVLWHFPHVKTHNFNSKYDLVQWRTSEEDFNAWTQGLTGYPVVDAAMRQLNTLGWMHNRARMIVASFLTKDLLINWRIGEQYFMQHLLDGDLAANNGGWQWAAGTGTDPQPYFRIFNPVAQSEKFDPDGIFIRYWLPELRDIPAKYIHAPWTMPTPPKTYPTPIIDHIIARDRALSAFAVVRKKQ